jgi:hypothetical protein
LLYVALHVPFGGCAPERVSSDLADLSLDELSTIKITSISKPAERLSDAVATSTRQRTGVTGPRSDCRTSGQVQRNYFCDGPVRPNTRTRMRFLNPLQNYELYRDIYEAKRKLNNGECTRFDRSITIQERQGDLRYLASIEGMGGAR